jgi:hypothetical protein
MGPGGEVEVMGPGGKVEVMGPGGEVEVMGLENRLFHMLDALIPLPLWEVLRPSS